MRKRPYADEQAFRAVGDESGVNADFPYGGEASADVERRERVAFREGYALV